MKKYKLKSILICIILISCGTIAYLQTPNHFYKKKIPNIEQNKSYLVDRVLDGDTFIVKIDNKSETVRMLGIDTPETVDPRKPIQCFGKEASHKTKELLNGKSVILKIDSSQNILDKYNRILAYVYVDNFFINKYLIENGYAREYTYQKAYTFQKDFKKLMKQAQNQKLGLWGVCSNI